jgi:MFS family permease
MLAADIGLAVLVGSIPLAAALGLLKMELLYGVGFLIGVLRTFFELAYQSYLPVLVEREHLVEGNSKMQASASAAQIGGPGLAGVLVEWVGAPMALSADALSFFVSALGLALIRKPERVPVASSNRVGPLRRIADGFRWVLRSPMLRSLAGGATTFNIFTAVIETVLVLYAVRHLGIRPGTLGVIFAAGSTGSLLGALLAGPTAARFGLGRAFMVSALIAGLGPLLLPLAAGTVAVAALILTLAQFVSGVGASWGQVYAWSVRQAATPEAMLGRMNAAYRFFVTGFAPLGAILGGILGGSIGPRATLLVGGIGLLLGILWYAFSPLSSLARLPEPQGV